MDRAPSTRRLPRRSISIVRLLRPLVPLVAVAMFVGGTAASTLAGSPYMITERIHAHKVLEYDPGFVWDACFVATGDLSEVFNGQAHIIAAGIDEEGNFIPPLHYETTVEESVLFQPLDATLPTYTGHSTVHVRNFIDSSNAGYTNTVVLRGSDGSHVVWHEDVHLRVTSNGLVIVDHPRCSVR